MGWVHLTELGESFINSSAEGEMSDQLMRYLNVLYTVLEENMKGMPISEDEIAERLSNLYPKDQVKKYVSLLAEKKAIEITGQKGGIDEGVYLMNPIPGVDYKIDSIMDRFAKEQKEPEKIKISRIESGEIVPEEITSEEQQKLRDEAFYEAWVEGRRYCKGYKPKEPYWQYGGKCAWADLKKYKRQKCESGVPKEVCRTGELYALKMLLKDPNSFQAGRFKKPTIYASETTREDAKRLAETGKRFTFVKHQYGAPVEIPMNPDYEYPDEIARKREAQIVADQAAQVYGVFKPEQTEQIRIGEIGVGGIGEQPSESSKIIMEESEEGNIGE